MVRVILEHLPELGEHNAGQFVAGAVMMTGAIWTHAHPAAAILAAYEADPSLEFMRMDFVPALREMLELLLSGLLARRPQGSDEPVVS